MTRTLTITAPAKINLTLDVFAPRPDGFHDLDSVVVKLSTVDTLTVTVDDAVPEPSFQFTCTEPSLPTDSRNLVVRAAEAILISYPRPLSVRIHLMKRLPVEAGLGGGSSDAAATLRAFGELLSLPHSDLLRIGATLGSDIPLFLTKGMVRMQGRGERIETIHASLELHGVLVKPAVGVATGPAYRLLDALPDRPESRSTEVVLAMLSAGARREEVSMVMHNDFEQVVLPGYPEVQAAYDAITRAGALRVLLCGSGSALFGLAADRHHAETLADRLQGQFPWVVATEALHV